MSFFPAPDMPKSKKGKNTRRPSAGSQSSNISTKSLIKTWKIIVVGSPTVGKTALVFKFTSDKLPDEKTGTFAKDM